MQQTDQLTRTDHGRINERLLQRYGDVDTSRIESAHRTIPIELSSPEAKRLFMRVFHAMQVAMHYVSTISRMTLDESTVEAAEAHMIKTLNKAAEQLDTGVADADRRFRAAGVQTIGAYHVMPLTIDAKVFSLFGRRYLELFTKLDHVMLLIETMAIDEIIPIGQVNGMKAAHKRSVRQVASTAQELRKRFLTLSRANQAAQAASTDTSNAAAGGADGDGDGQTRQDLSAAGADGDRAEHEPAPGVGDATEPAASQPALEGAGHPGTDDAPTLGAPIDDADTPVSAGAARAASRRARAATVESA